MPICKRLCVCNGWGESRVDPDVNQSKQKCPVARVREDVGRSRRQAAVPWGGVRSDRMEQRTVLRLNIDAWSPCLAWPGLARPAPGSDVRLGLAGLEIRRAADVFLANFLFWVLRRFTWI